MPMSCDEAIEYLPWLLNGSLEAGESGEVRRHLATCERCRAALNDTRDAWTVYSQHLPSEALVALAYGESPAGVDPALAERHLASCPECTAELELARTSRRLEEDDKIAVFPGPRRKEVTGEGERRSWRAAALAAGLAGVVAATGWVYELQQAGDLAERLARQPVPVQAPQSPPPAANPAPSAADQAKLEELRREQQQLQGQLAQAQQQLGELQNRVPKPRANGWSDLLVPVGDVARSATGAAPEKVLPRDADAVLILGTDNPDSGDRDVEVLDREGKVRFSLSGLHNQDSQYKLSIPAGTLGPGQYTIKLYPRANGTRGKADAYKLAVK